MSSRVLILWVIAALLLLLPQTLAIGSRPKLTHRPRSISGYRRTPHIQRGTDGQPLFWYCRRGSRLAICHRRTHRVKTATAPDALMARSQISTPKDISGACSPSTCLNGKCQNNDCKCRYGWTGRSCDKDTDECQTDDHLCQHRCTNTVGSYRCSCNAGYILQADGRTCRFDYSGRRTFARKQNKIPQKITNKAHSTRLTGDEFDISRGRSQRYYYAELLRKLAIPKLQPSQSSPKKSCRFARCQYRCVVNNNDAECTCPRGMKLAANKRSCTDINECVESTKAVCPSDQECSNTYGRFSCKCPSGQSFTYTLHGKICNDINECFTGDHECGRNARCTNTLGSYTCECLPGYHGDGVVCNEYTIPESAIPPSRRLSRHGMLPHSQNRYGISRLGQLKRQWLNYRA